MIERLLVKESLSITKAELEFGAGLMVFTGRSGAGKSILMDAILGAFGRKEANATLAEALISGLNLPEEYDDGEEEIVVRQLKKEKVRYFLGDQFVSKNRLKQLSEHYLLHLNHKDNGEFTQERLLGLIDGIASHQTKRALKVCERYYETYRAYLEGNKRLQELREQQANLEELKAFAEFEIEKIAAVDPKLGEEEELKRMKKMLSKKDKIDELCQQLEPLFGMENSVFRLYELLDEESVLFSDAMNEVRGVMESAADRMAELEEVDIESLLDRIEKIAELTKRHGSIEEALVFKAKKEEELKGYASLDEEVSGLEVDVQKLLTALKSAADDLSGVRQKALTTLQKELDGYLKMLYMPTSKVGLRVQDIGPLGQDYLSVELNGTALERLSSGETNRMRLALLAVRAKFSMASSSRVLILDEIDANLSGEESASVAKVLGELSKSYQIFAISHQAQLSSAADKHFLVEKKKETTTIRELNPKERIQEIARIVSGEAITDEALSFAKQLF